jgi:hypothetical protein
MIYQFIWKCRLVKKYQETWKTSWYCFKPTSSTAKRIYNPIISHLSLQTLHPQPSHTHFPVPCRLHSCQERCFHSDNSDNWEWNKIDSQLCSLSWLIEQSSLPTLFSKVWNYLLVFLFVVKQRVNRCVIGLILCGTIVQAVRPSVITASWF